MSSKESVVDSKFIALAKNLKKIQESKRFGNYRKMAGLLRIHHQTLSKIVRLRKEPSAMLIQLMAKTFAVSPETLLSEEDFIVAEHPEIFPMDAKRRELVEKFKQFLQVADEGAINALLHNVDEFSKGAVARRELEELKKK